MRKRYAAQVELLVSAIPAIASEQAFALKGGTAINLFYRDMPRLSVDIDLTYLPLDERSVALTNIDAAFERMAARARDLLPAVQVQRIAGGEGGDTRMQLQTRDAQVKIEVSPVARGTLGKPQKLRVTEPVEDQFGFAETAVVSFEDLYAGKLCAALDRQHPRDLFDVRLLYAHEGLTPGLFSAFLVYAACSSRPLHELIDPLRLEIDRAFAQEFDGMTFEHVGLEALLETRDRLIADVQSRLTGAAADFLLSVHNGNPDFALIGQDAAAVLPAVRWKLVNIERLKAQDAGKHASRSSEARPQQFARCRQRHCRQRTSAVRTYKKRRADKRLRVRRCRRFYLAFRAPSARPDPRCPLPHPHFATPRSRLPQGCSVLVGPSQGSSQRTGQAKRGSDARAGRRSSRILCCSLSAAVRALREHGVHSP